MLLKKIISTVLFSSSLLCMSVAFAASNNTTASNSPKIITYISEIDNQNPPIWQDPKIPYDKIDVIDIAFLGILNDNRYASTGSITAGKINLKQIVTTIRNNAAQEDPNNHLKIVVSIGSNAAYHIAFKNPHNFVTSVNNMLKNDDLDGVNFEVAGANDNPTEVAYLISSLRAEFLEENITPMVMVTPDATMAEGLDWKGLSKDIDLVVIPTNGEADVEQDKTFHHLIDDEQFTYNKIILSSDIEGGFPSSDTLSSLTNKAYSIQNLELGGMILWRLGNDKISGSQYGSVDALYKIFDPQ